MSPTNAGLITIINWLVSGLAVVVTTICIGFVLDATLGRLLGLPAILRHRQSGIRAVLGELGCVIGIAVMFAESRVRSAEGELPWWLAIPVLIGLILALIGESAGKAEEE